MIKEEKERLITRIGEKDKCPLSQNGKGTRFRLWGNVRYSLGSSPRGGTI